MFKKSRRKISCGELFSVLENYCILNSSTVEFIESMDVETKKRREDVLQEMSNFAHTYRKKMGNEGVSLDKNFYLICKGLEYHISYNADPDLHLALRIENLDIVGSGEIMLSWVGSISKFRFKNCRFIENGESNLFLRMNFVPKDDNISKARMLNFIFEKNKYDIRDIHIKSYEFCFPKGSYVFFSQNDCGNCVVHHNDYEKWKVGEGLSFEFDGNKFGSLRLNCVINDCRFIGCNKIEDLFMENIIPCRLDNIHRDIDLNDLQKTIYFGRSEKIDPNGKNPFYTRKLFVKLKDLAAKKNDVSQVNIFSSYLSKIEYAIVKKEKWYKKWQDRILMGWQCWSSDFYTSYTRPVILLIVGYSALNFLPFLWIENFSWYDWLKFSIRNPTKIVFYSEELKTVLGVTEYETLSTKLNKIWLDFIGLLQIIWLALCGYAFRNAIRTYFSK